jgi:hypothetical protein
MSAIVRQAFLQGELIAGPALCAGPSGKKKLGFISKGLQ